MPKLQFVQLIINRLRGVRLGSSFSGERLNPQYHRAPLFYILEKFIVENIINCEDNVMCAILWSCEPCVIALCMAYVM